MIKNNVDRLLNRNKETESIKLHYGALNLLR